MAQSLQAQDLAPNKAAGLEAARRAVAKLPHCSLVPDAVAMHYDAVATAPVSPSRAVPFVGLCLLERGTRIEVKSVRQRYADGQRGRFYLRTDQHESLLDHGGVYLFVVTTEDASGRRPVACKIVPATTVDGLLPDGWLDGGPDRSDYRQVAWSRVFEPAEVDR